MCWVLIPELRYLLFRCPTCAKGVSYSQAGHDELISDLQSSSDRPIMRKGGKTTGYNAKINDAAWLMNLLSRYLVATIFLFGSQKGTRTSYCLSWLCLFRLSPRSRRNSESLILLIIADLKIGANPKVVKYRGYGLESFSGHWMTEMILETSEDVLRAQALTRSSKQWPSCFDCGPQQ